MWVMGGMCCFMLFIYVVVLMGVFVILGIFIWSGFFFKDVILVVVWV